jgi:hypothetical protein
MKTLIAILVVLVAVFHSVSASAVDQTKPYVVLVAGTLHYSPELSMPLFAKELERLGFRTTVVMGDGDPEKKTEHVLPGIEILSKADVAIFFMRFLKLPDQEWQPIEDYIKSGKPLIGLRTANHSFKYPKSHARFHWNDGFGRRALGTPYIVHQSSATQISVIDKNTSHPVMTHVSKTHVSKTHVSKTHVSKTQWESEGTLYLTRLEGGCLPLLSGTGQGRGRLLQKTFWNHLGQSKRGRHRRMDLGKRVGRKSVLHFAGASG